MPKLLALDLDGTTFSVGQEIPAVTRDALCRARRAGHLVSFITGRRLLAPLRELCELGDYLVLNNGGTVHKLPELTLLSCRMALREDMRCLLDYCNAHSLPLHMITETYWGINLDTELVGELTQDWRYGKTLYRSIEELPFDTLDGFMVTGERCLEAQTFIEAEGLELSCLHSEPTLLDIVPRGVDKWQGAQYVAALHGIDHRDIVGMGDYYNDLALIEGAGIGVAVQNAPEDLKARADYVSVRTNLEGAVAEVVDKFILGGACV